MSRSVVEAARLRRLEARGPQQDPLLTTTHEHAESLLVTAKDLRRRADDAAWNFDMDQAEELQRRSDHFKAEAEELLLGPNAVMPLF